MRRIGQMRNTHTILVVKHKGKRPLGRSRRRWEDNVRMDLKVIRWVVVEWIFRLRL